MAAYVVEFNVVLRINKEGIIFGKNSSQLFAKVSLVHIVSFKPFETPQFSNRVIKAVTCVFPLPNGKILSLANPTNKAVNPFPLALQLCGLRFGLLPSISFTCSSVFSLPFSSKLLEQDQDCKRYPICKRISQLQAMDYSSRIKPMDRSLDIQMRIGQEHHLIDVLHLDIVFQQEVIWHP